MPLLKNAAIGLGAALVLIAVLFTLSSIGSSDLVVEPPGGGEQETITLVSSLISVLVTSSIATAFAFVLRFLVSSKSKLIFLIVGVGFATVSLLSPVISASTNATAVWLVSFHIGVAAPMIYFLSSGLPSEKAVGPAHSSTESKSR